MGTNIDIARYDERTGISLVRKSGRWGTYSNVVVVSNEDADIASGFTGCNFAEYKCDIEAQHEKARYYKARYDGIDMAYKNLKQSVLTSDGTMIKLHRQRSIARRDYEREYGKYVSMRDNYDKYVEAVLKSRRTLLSKINDDQGQPTTCE